MYIASVPLALPEGAREHASETGATEDRHGLLEQGGVAVATAQ